MATRTSAKSGLWSATDTWVGGVVPIDNDAFVIDSAHDVVFDVDQSTMAAGMAASTIKGILRFDTTKDTFLKMKANLTFTAVSGSPANLFVGNSWDDPIPRGVTATIQFPAANYYLNGNTNAAFFFGWVPEHSHSTVATAAMTGATSITFTDDMELIAGEQIVIGATGAPMVGDRNDYRMTTGVKGLHTIQTYDAVTKTATLTEPLEHDRAAGDLVGRFTRQIRIRRVAFADYPCTNLLNAHFEGVLFENTGGPGSHQGYGWMGPYRVQFPEIDAGVFHSTAYNTGTGGLAGSPSQILIEDSVVYRDTWDSGGRIQGVIHSRDGAPSAYGAVKRIVCINTHGTLADSADGCLFEDIVTQNTGGNSGWINISNCVIRRWVNKSPTFKQWAIYTANCTFEDCSPNTVFETASQSPALSRFTNIDGVPGADASLSVGGMFFWQRDERPKILRGKTTSRIWHDYPVFFPAGVPLTFAVRCRIRDAFMQARFQIIDPASDPVACDMEFRREINWQWFDWLFDGENEETIPAADSTSKIVGPISGCLAEVELPDDIEVDEWAVLRLTYTSATDRTLWVRLWANDWQTFAQYWGLPPWDGDNWYTPPNTTIRVEFDVSAVEAMLGQAAHVPRTTDCRYCP